MLLHIEEETLVVDESGHAIAICFTPATETNQQQAIINANIIVACVNAMPKEIIDSIIENCTKKVSEAK